MQGPEEEYEPENTLDTVDPFDDSTPEEPSEDNPDPDDNDADGIADDGMDDDDE